MWKKFLKDFFSFSSADRNGIVILSLLIVVVLIAAILFPGMRHRLRKPHLADFESLVSGYYLEGNKTHQEDIRPDLKLFQFDPNRIGREEMQMLGFSDKLIRTFENYLASGGRFRNSGDLKKIYGMPDSLYRKLQPFVEITSPREIMLPEKTDQTTAEKPMIELNSADTAMLKKLSGIGPVYSLRIVKYRDLLGGFYTIDQIREVYGISNELFEKISGQIEVDTSYLKKIDINNASFTQLLRHPYISKDQADKITRHLRNEGCFSSPEELLIKGVLDSLSYRKLRNYLMFYIPEVVDGSLEL